MHTVTVSAADAGAVAEVLERLRGSGVVVEYTDPAAFISGIAEGWAEPVTDPTLIDWAERQAQAWIPFEVVNGRPVNPCEKTAVQRGRGELGVWGESKAADAVVTCTCGGGRWLLMVERKDGHGWAIPGGGVDGGETAAQAASRELAEEAGFEVPASAWRVGEPTYVPDPRASDEAWMVTAPCHVDLGAVDVLPEVTGGDDAAFAAWIHADSYDALTSDLAANFDGAVFAAHVDLLTQICGPS